MSIRRFIVVAVGLIAGIAQADTYGKLEHVRVGDKPAVEVTAKFDTGADRSSLHAVDVKYFQRDGGTWVRFIVDNGSVLPGNRVTLERPVLKDVKIKQKGGGVEHRPLIELDLCIGERSIKSTLNLSDRTGYTAPLLIGTEDLAILGAVDVTRQFTHEPSCKPANLSLNIVETPARAAGSKAAPVTAPTSPDHGH